MFLTDTTHSIEVVTGSAVTTSVAASFVDHISGLATPGNQFTGITTATTTTVVSAPAADTDRQLQVITIANTHASSSQTVQLQVDVSGVDYPLHEAIVLLAGESLSYDGKTINLIDRDCQVIVYPGELFTVENTLTLKGINDSTLDIGTGGTLGSAAFTASTAYAPTAGSSNITTVGTITTGTWNGSTIDQTYLDAQIAYKDEVNVFSNVQQIGDGTESASILYLDAANETYRLLSARTGGSCRWYIGADNSTESGSDTGSNFMVGRCSDAGGLVDTPLSINRATGKATFGNDLQVDGDFTSSNRIDQAYLDSNIAYINEENTFTSEQVINKSITNHNALDYAQQVKLYNTSTIDVTTYAIAGTYTAKTQIDSGVTDSGYVMGADIGIYRGYSSDLGTLTESYGLRVDTGHDTGVGATATTTIINGVYSRVYLGAGTINTASAYVVDTTYTGATVGTLNGLVIPNLKLSGVTNSYGINIASQSAGGYAIKTGTGLHEFGDAVSISGAIAADTHLDLADGDRVKLYFNDASAVNAYKLEKTTAVDGGDGLMKYTLGSIAPGELGFFGSTATSTMLINTKTGKVGIGNNTPGAELDVNGDINVASGQSYKVNDTQVVGAQQTAVADATSTDATDLASAITLVNELKTQLNSALAKLRTHGLIAT